VATFYAASYGMDHDIHSAKDRDLDAIYILGVHLLPADGQ